MRKKRKNTLMKWFGQYFADHRNRLHSCVAMLLGLLFFSAAIGGFLMIQYKDVPLAAILLSCAGVALPVLILHLVFREKETVKVTTLVGWISTVLSIVVCTCFLFASRYVASILFWAPIAGVSAMLFLDFITGFTAAIVYFIETTVFLLTPYISEHQPSIDGPFKVVFFMTFATAFVLGIISTLSSTRINETLEANKERFRELAFIDSLTGLNNNSYLADYKSSFEIKEGEEIGILFVDVDDLKYINDTFGHPIGNLALNGVANAIKEKAPDVAIRYGGDEFLVLQRDSNPKALMALGNSIEEAVQAIEIEEAPLLKLSCSIGAYCGKPKTQADLDAFIREADKQVYIIKKNGKAGVSIKK